MYSFYNGFLFFIVLLFLLWSSSFVNSKIRKHFINLAVVFLVLLFVYYIYFNCVRNHFIKEGFDINEYGPGPFGEITNMYQFQLQNLASPVVNMPIREFSQKVVIDDSKNIRLVPDVDLGAKKGIIEGILIFKIERFIYFVSINGVKLSGNKYRLNRAIPSQFIIPDSFYYFGECDTESYNPRNIYVYSIDKIERFEGNGHGNGKRIYPDYLLGSLESSEITILRSQAITVNSLPFNENDGFSVFQVEEPGTGYVLSGWTDTHSSKFADLSIGQNIVIVFDIYDLGLYMSFNQIKQTPTESNNMIAFVNKLPDVFLNKEWRFKIYNGSKPTSYQGGDESLFFFRRVNSTSFTQSVQEEEKEIKSYDKTKEDSTPQLETHCYSCFSTDPKKIYYKIDQSGENAQPMGISLPDDSYNQECSQFPLSMFGTDAIKCDLNEQSVYLTGSEKAMDDKYGSRNLRENLGMNTNTNTAIMNKNQSNKKTSNIHGKDVDIDQIKTPTTLNINVAYYTRDGGNMDSSISDNDNDIKNNRLLSGNEVNGNSLLSNNKADVSFTKPDENTYVFDNGLHKVPSNINNVSTTTTTTTRMPVNMVNTTTTKLNNNIPEDIEPNTLVEHINAVRNGGNWNKETENDCKIKGTCDKIEKVAQEKAQQSFDKHIKKQTNNWNVGNDFNNQFTNQSGVALGGGTCNSEGANYFCRYSYLPINPAFYKPVADIMDNYNGVNSAPSGYSTFPSTKKWLQNNKEEVDKYKDFYNNYYKNVNELRYSGITGNWKGYKPSNPPL